MDTDFILQEFNCLSLNEQERILQLLTDQWDQQEERFNNVMKELETVQVRVPACVHCESQQTIKSARIKMIQRYYCKSCKKYWMATHGTSLAGLHKRDLWQKYVVAFERGYTIRKAAQELGISIQTSFRWRHRLLASISGILRTELSGIIETIDFQLPRNTKGQRKIGQDHSVRYPKNISVLLSSSRTDKLTTSSIIAAEKPDSEQIRKALKGKFRHGSILISQVAEAFSFLKEEMNFEYTEVPVRKRPRKKNPINVNVVMMHRQAFQHFLLPFHGVATKYLQNYLNWYHYREKMKMRLDKVQQTLLVCLAEPKALDWIEKLSIKNTIIII